MKQSSFLLKEFKGVISILGYFILGILCVSLFLPLIDALASLLLTTVEVAKGYFSLKVAEYNQQLQKVTYGEDYDAPKRLIGFARETEEDLDDDI